MHGVWSIAKLVRLDTSVLVFLSVFVPLFARTGSLESSLRGATPLLFIAMCAFLVNDLDDLETDKSNHPQRPLPSGQVTPVLATLLYFGFLAIALFTSRGATEARVAFWYYALIVLVVSYGYVVDYLASIKAIYVAFVSSMPVLIVTRFYPGEPSLYLVVAATFMFILARELCMDFVDRDGDKPSFMRNMSANHVGVAVAAAHAIGISLLVPLVDTPARIAALAALLLLSALSVLLWTWSCGGTGAQRVTKAELFIGLYFLV